MLCFTVLRFTVLRLPYTRVFTFYVLYNLHNVVYVVRVYLLPVLGSTHTSVVVVVVRGSGSGQW